jgi:hypothetical protein
MDVKRGSYFKKNKVQRKTFGLKEDKVSSLCYLSRDIVLRVVTGEEKSATVAHACCKR